MGENDGKMSRSNLHGVQSSRPLHMQGTASETNSLKKKKKKQKIINISFSACRTRRADPEGGPDGHRPWERAGHSRLRAGKTGRENGAATLQRQTFK